MSTALYEPRKPSEIASELREVRASLTNEPKDIDAYVEKVDSLVRELLIVRPELGDTGNALNYLDRLIEKAAS
jgi:hypothetical protein